MTRVLWTPSQDRADENKPDSTGNVPFPCQVTAAQTVTYMHGVATLVTEASNIPKDSSSETRALVAMEWALLCFLLSSCPQLGCCCVSVRVFPFPTVLWGPCDEGHGIRLVGSQPHNRRCQQQL